MSATARQDYDDESELCTRTDPEDRVYDCFHVNNAFMQQGELDYPIDFSDTIGSSHSSQVSAEISVWDTQPPRFFTMAERIADSHQIGGLFSQMKPLAWQYELSYVNDESKRDYLQEGIMRGFRIVDDVNIPYYESTNYNSCFTRSANDYVSNLFRDELKQEKIIPAVGKPHCVHAMGIITKKDGTYRPITDCRRPLGNSINNFMNSTCQSFRYKTLDTVCDKLRKGDYMCCTDIKAAYRSISIFPSHRKYQGFKWSMGSEGPRYYMDTRLCFGLKCAPFIFNEISDFIVQCMSRRGHNNIINYLDDYFCWGPTFESCAATQNALIRLLGQLGFMVAWSKCSSPSTTCVFLGIQIDSNRMSMSLPQEKLQKLLAELEFFQSRDRATVKQLQRLCGVLSYASHVVRGGRTFSRRVINLLKGLNPTIKRIRLSHEFKMDLEWWRSWATRFNGEATMIQHNYGQGIGVESDASLSGFGAISSNGWCAGYFNSRLIPHIFQENAGLRTHWINLQTGTGIDININVLELMPIWLSCILWGEHWRDHQIICWSDNTQVVSSINKGISINRVSMSLLRQIFWFSVRHNFHLVARHIPGVINLAPDFLSRVGQEVSLGELSKYVSSHSRQLRLLG